MFSKHFWAILKASLDLPSLVGIFTGALTLTGFLKKYGGVPLSRIVAAFLDEYHKVFHVAVDEGVRALCALLKLPDWHLADLTKDLLVLFVIICGAYLRSRSVSKRIFVGHLLSMKEKLDQFNQKDPRKLDFPDVDERSLTWRDFVKLAFTLAAVLVIYAGLTWFPMVTVIAGLIFAIFAVGVTIRSIISSINEARGQRARLALPAEYVEAQAMQSEIGGIQLDITVIQIGAVGLAIALFIASNMAGL